MEEGFVLTLVLPANNLYFFRFLKKPTIERVGIDVRVVLVADEHLHVRYQVLGIGRIRGGRLRMPVINVPHTSSQMSPVQA